MKNESKSLKRLIVACGVLCGFFVAFLSVQSWGTIDYVVANVPEEMADVQWLRVLLVFLVRIWRGAAAGKLFIRGNHRWLYALSALYFVYSLVDGNAGHIIYNGIRQLEIYINEYMLITCFVLIVFAKLYAIAVEVSEEQELTI